MTVSVVVSSFITGVKLIYYECLVNTMFPGLNISLQCSQVGSSILDQQVGRQHQATRVEGRVI